MSHKKGGRGAQSESSEHLDDPVDNPNTIRLWDSMKLKHFFADYSWPQGLRFILASWV